MQGGDGRFRVENLYPFGSYWHARVWQRKGQVVQSGLSLSRSCHGAERSTTRALYWLLLLEYLHELDGKEVMDMSGEQMS